MLYTIGFLEKSAETFFTLMQENQIELLVDIRLWPATPDAGFAKSDDLAYLLQEVADCGYAYEPIFSPTEDLLSGTIAGRYTWADYQVTYAGLMQSRDMAGYFFDRYNPVAKNICLLCAEHTAAQCHRRLLAEELQAKRPEVEVVHL
ncbi:MAG: DUF488 domain-containing protein [Oscillospiraceae bacterium]|nr:DUF488 domain-containing protein [Oscillospiraceae bacterium]